MKTFVFICCLTVLTLMNPIVSSAESPSFPVLDETLSAAENIQIPDFNFAKTVKSLTDGTFSLSPDSLLQNIVNALTKELKNNMGILVKILVLSIIAGILAQLQTGFSDSDIAEISFLACFALVAGLSVTIIAQINETAVKTIDTLMLFIAGLIPVMGTLSFSANSPFLSFYPDLFALMQTFITLCKTFFLPLISTTTALSVVNALSKKLRMTRLIDFMRQIVKWGLGILLTVFVGILGIHSFTAASFGIGGRAAKYVISNFVPLVGNVLSESAEAVLRSLKLIRGAVGVSGIIAILTICFLPIVKILVTALIYRFAAGVAEPATDNRIISLLIDLSGNITLIFAIVMMVTVMFIISVAMLCALVI